MYSTLLFLHSLFRWLVLGSLLCSFVLARRGFLQNRSFTAGINSLRHWTATIAHVQLLLGITLFFKSPLLQLDIAASQGKLLSEPDFFRYVHVGLMLIAVILITIGSAKAKRMASDREKYRTMFTWFGIGLLLIFLAIPWPFSPEVVRPLLRSF